VRDQYFKLKYTLWLIVAVVLVYYFVHRLDWAEIKLSFQGLNRTLAAAAVLPIMATYLVRALRWRAFIAPMGKPSFRNLFAATVIGFASIFIFGRVGEVARPVMLSLRERIRPSATFATIMIERLYDSTAVVLLFAIDLALLDRLITNRHLGMVRWVGFGLLAASVLGIIGLSLFRGRANSVLNLLEIKLAWWPQKIRRVVLNLLRHLADGLYVLHDLRGLVITVGYTMLIWGLVTFSFWLVVRAFGLPLSLLSVIFILGFALVGSLVPTPGGSAGAFHTTTMVALILLGVEPNKAASVAIAMHFVAFGSALVFGIYFFIRDGISLKDLRAMIADEMVPPVDPDDCPGETQARVIGAKS
jgi:hypothetical protein